MASEDSTEALRAILASAESLYRAAVVRGDQSAIVETGFHVLKVRDALRAAQPPIENSELVKALADLISGQIGGGNGA